MTGTIKPRKTPLRTCISCKTMKDKSELIRIVRSPEGGLFFDRTGKANGRGAYICDNADCVAKCLKKKLLNKAFKTEVSDEVYKKLSEEYGC